MEGEEGRGDVWEEYGMAADYDEVCYVGVVEVGWGYSVEVEGIGR